MKTYKCRNISRSYILKVEIEGKSREIRAIIDFPESWTVVYEDNLEKVSKVLAIEIIDKIVLWSFFNSIPDKILINQS